MSNNQQDNARRIAYDVLHDVLNNGAYANLRLDKALFSCVLEQRDRNLVTDLVYGTIKYKRHLETVLDAYSDKPIQKVDSKTATILLMSVYQLRFLDRIPAHAVINEAVALAKQLGLSSHGFINAVLRAASDDKKQVVWPDKRRNKPAYLSKFYSFPQWVIELWVKAYGFSATETICRYMNETPRLWARTNTLACDRNALAESFRRDDVETIPSQHADVGLQLLHPGALRRTEAFQKGYFVMQDESAMLPALALAPKDGDTVLDMCAAPGGKTTQLAALMHNTGTVVACDIHPHRVALIEENCQRLGVTNVQSHVQDVTKLPHTWQQRFDCILADVPCSGLGVLNRRVDARWQKLRSDLPALIKLQRQILEQAASVLKPGGRLIYSTCTLHHAENEGQVEAFLADHPEFQCMTDLDQHWQGLPSDNGMIEIRPDLHDMDGFFIAGLVKKEDAHAVLA